MTIRIPVAKPDISDKEEAYVLEALRSTWISSSGPFLERFERVFAEECGVEHAIAVSNGTVALHLAMLGLDLRPGDEVLVPSLTYVATANAVRYVGAEPVFVDVDPETWAIDPSKLEAAITRRTKGIVAVHLYGHPADMDAINHLAGVHGLWVVEDAAEAHTARYRSQPVGGLGRIGTFSFYGNKLFTSGEGGCVTVHDRQLALRLRTLRGQGVDPGRRYFFPVTGYNFRLTNLAAALLCAQLERRDEILARRSAIYARYSTALAGIPGIGLQPRSPWVEVAPWLYSITVDPRSGTTRDALMDALAAKGIESRPFFIPLHGLPPFREASLARGESLPVTNDLAARGMNLPTYNTLTEEDQREIIATIQDHMGHRA